MFLTVIFLSVKLDLVETKTPANFGIISSFQIVEKTFKWHNSSYKKVLKGAGAKVYQ